MNLCAIFSRKARALTLSALLPLGGGISGCSVPGPTRPHITTAEDCGVLIDGRKTTKFDFDCLAKMRAQNAAEIEQQKELAAINILVAHAKGEIDNKDRNSEFAATLLQGMERTFNSIEKAAAEREMRSVDLTLEDLEKWVEETQMKIACEKHAARGVTDLYICNPAPGI